LLNLFDPADRRHSLELWQEIIDVNLTAVFLVTRALVARMAEQRIRGVVVSMSSIAARGNAGQGAYSAAKAGVEALTRAWAKELGVLGFRFLAIAPGFVDTASTRTALSEEALAELKRRTPLRRLGQADEIAAAVLYALQNDMATGTVLEVDGGLTL
jgi:3-oxoacyl-[acyl-carrier protein] reductase